jgi:hypothetical protein
LEDNGKTVLQPVREKTWSFSSPTCPASASSRKRWVQLVRFRSHAIASISNLPNAFESLEPLFSDALLFAIRGRTRKDGPRLASSLIRKEILDQRYVGLQFLSVSNILNDFRERAAG